MDEASIINLSDSTEGSLSRIRTRWADMSEDEDDDITDCIYAGKRQPQTLQKLKHSPPPQHSPPETTLSSLLPLAQPTSKQVSAQPKPRQKTGVRGRQNRGHDTKHQCQFVVGIEEESQFRVVRRIIGAAGANMKFIADQAGPDTRLRLRGRGSKFFEGPNYQEAPEPLMLCVSVRNRTAYEIATGLVREQLGRVYEEYDAFREANGKHPLGLRVRMHEGPRAGSR